MPEGPEVRRYADLLAVNLEDETLVRLWTRLKIAKAWLAGRETEIVGQKILKIRSHGKHLLCYFGGDFYFHSHLMMWGKWLVFDSAPEEIDRRERARIETARATAILFSAPTFTLGQGEPYEQIPILAELGADVLPYTGDFDAEDFVRRLFSAENLEQTIGAALLNQRLVAGIGNYLRAEILYNCKINPWTLVSQLTTKDVECLSYTIPHFSLLAYKTGGRTITDDERERLLTETGMSYRAGSDWGARHYVFRRTNLPCLVCGTKIKQKRQITYADEEREKTRIIYFCPNCQRVE